MRMMHPKHGYHVCAPHEFEEMTRNGWVMDDGKALAAKRAARNLAIEVTVESTRAELDALGIKWDGRWGLEKLLAAKP